MAGQFLEKLFIESVAYLEVDPEQSLAALDRSGFRIKAYKLDTITRQIDGHIRFIKYELSLPTQRV